MGQRRVGLRPWRSGRPADKPARRDLLRPRPADARRSAGISAPDAGMVSLPETPPDASRAAPSGWPGAVSQSPSIPVSYTHLRAHETRHDLVCRLLLEKKKPKK